jgi:uncharacterized protein
MFPPTSSHTPPPARLRGLTRAAGAALLFAALYLLALAALLGAGTMDSMARAQWGALLAAVLATLLAGRMLEGRIPDAGLRVHPRRALSSIASGAAIAAIAVGAGHALILLSSGLSLEGGRGLAAADTLLVVLPAALHEELLFRGWAFQKLARWSAPLAVAGGAVLFGILHAGNPDIGWLGLANITVAGVMLSLAFLAFRNLWAPIALHYSWNVFSGPVLGYEVSGWRPSATLFSQSDPGPAFLTGGNFGIEGSIWMIVVQVPIVIALALKVASHRRRERSDTIRAGIMEGKEIS